MTADLTDPEALVAEIADDVARYRAERHAEYAAGGNQVRELIQDENAALEARAAVAELQWRHAKPDPWIDRFEDLQQRLAVQNVKWAAEHNCAAPANPVTTNTLVKLAESDRRRKAEAESLIARVEDCLDQRLTDVHNAQFQGTQGVDNASEDSAHVVGVGLSSLGAEDGGDVGYQLIGDRGRVAGLAAAEVERVSEGHDSSPSLDGVDSLSVGESPRPDAEPASGAGHQGARELCGLIVHRKGCTCGGWSKRACDYAPGFVPPRNRSDRESLEGGASGGAS